MSVSRWWCGHCRDHFDRKHYADGRHIVGAGPYGKLQAQAAQAARLGAIEEAAREVLAALDPVLDVRYSDSVVADLDAALCAAVDTLRAALERDSTWCEIEP